MAIVRPRGRPPAKKLEKKAKKRKVAVKIIPTLEKYYEFAEKSTLLELPEEGRVM